MVFYKRVLTVLPKDNRYVLAFCQKKFLRGAKTIGYSFYCFSFFFEILGGKNVLGEGTRPPPPSPLAESQLLTRDQHGHWLCLKSFQFHCIQPIIQNFPKSKRYVIKNDVILDPTKKQIRESQNKPENKPLHKQH